MKHATDDSDQLEEIDTDIIEQWMDGLATLLTAENAANDALETARQGRPGSYEDVLNAFLDAQGAIASVLASYTAGVPSKIDLARAAAAAAAARLATARVRVSELRSALRRATTSLLGQVHTDVPLLLLPVRLETRFDFADGTTTLKIRVYPDDIHLDRHEPDLTVDERTWGQRYWGHQGAPGSATDRAAWRQLASRFGTRRAAWIVLATAPGAPGGTRPGMWTRAVQATLLPDRWIALAYRGSHPMVVAVSAPVIHPISVGASPASQAAPTTSSDDGIPPVDTAMRWMIDFEAALACGMALRLPLNNAPNLADQGIDRLLVLGLRGSLDARQSAGQLQALFDAHRFTSGIGLLPLDTPTNNTDDAGAGQSAVTQPDSALDEIDRAYARERGHPQLAPGPMPGEGERKDGHWLAWGLGLAADAFGRAHAAAGNEVAQSIAALATVTPQADSALLRRLNLGRAASGTGMPWACATGILPSFRVGTQPYAVLPAMARHDATDGARSADSWHVRLSILSDDLRHRGAAARGFRAAADITALISQTGCGSLYYQATIPDETGATQVEQAALSGIDNLSPQIAWPDGMPDRRKRDAVDALARRPDVWISAWATQRLAALRSARQQGLRLGAWGYVEDLRPAPPLVADEWGSDLARPVYTSPGNHGYLQTPSLAHAATAAVLRSGYEAGTGAAAVDLSSVRVQRAKWLLDGVRQGQSVAALLGYRFERRLQEAGLAQYLAHFRTLAGIQHDDAISAAITGVAVAERALAVEQQKTIDYDQADALVKSWEYRLQDVRQRLDVCRATRTLGEAIARQVTQATTDLEGASWDLRKHADERPVGKSEYDPRKKPPITRSTPDEGEFDRWSEKRARLDRIIADKRAKLADCQAQQAAQAAAYAAALSNLAAGAPLITQEQQTIQALEEAIGVRTRLPMPNEEAAKAKRDQAVKTLRDARFASWAEAMESNVVFQVIDGLELHRRWRLAQSTDPRPEWSARTIPLGDTELGFPPPGSEGFDRLLVQLRMLADEVDAIADLSVAESVFQLVRGSPSRAGAALDVLSPAGAAPPADYEVIRTPRSGVAVTHRVLSLLPNTALPQNLWTAGDDCVRAAAEPALEAYAAAMLPAPANIVCTWERRSADGAEMIDPGRATADLLALSALDFIACAAASAEFANGRTDTELGQRLDAFYRAVHPELPADTLVHWRPLARDGLANHEVPLADAVELGAALHHLLTSARPLEVRDLGGAGAGIDLAEVAARIARVRDRTDTLSRSFDQAIAAARTDLSEPRLAELRALLLRATYWRIPGALPVSPNAFAGPAGTTDTARQAAAYGAGLLAQASAVAQELSSRVASCGLLAADPANTRFETLLEQARALLGGDALVLPLINQSDVNPQWRESMVPGGDLFGTDTSATTGSTWIQQAGYVREGVSRLQRALGYLGALELPGAGELIVGQYPWSRGERWVGMAPTPGTQVLRGRTSTVSHLPFGAVTDTFKGLVHDEWVELVPCGQDCVEWKETLGNAATEITGLAFHFDSPNAAAPNVAVLAVAGHDARVWDLNLLQRTVLDAVDLAKARSAPADGRTELLWFTDEAPRGAILGSDYTDRRWIWVRSNPSPLSGQCAHRDLARIGFHQHYFTQASSDASLVVDNGDTLITYVYLEPGQRPQALIVQWVCTDQDGQHDWEHRAVWCKREVYDAEEPWKSSFWWGKHGTPSRYWAGPLPATGAWIRLEVAARDIGLEGKPVNGMGFGVIDGGATWGAAGHLVPAAATKPWHALRNDLVWMYDRPPAGAVLESDHSHGAWQWVTEQPTPYSALGLARSSHYSPAASGLHQHTFTEAREGMLVAIGDRLFAYVWLDPVQRPTLLMLQWCVNGDWGHRAFWGADAVPPELAGWTLGQPGLHRVGPLPAPNTLGTWVRLEVPAADVALEGRVVNGMAFTLAGGSAAWGPVGVSRPALSNALIFQ
jgi:hypothetical protein